MASRYVGSEIVTSGRYKGQHIDDVEDVIWAVGYQLPGVFSSKDQSLATWAMRAISNNHLNIEALPSAMRVKVNEFHYKYGVGRVKDVDAFNTRCHFHQDSAIQPTCKQCQDRRGALKMAHLVKQDQHLTRGILVRSWWRPPVNERMLNGLVKLQDGLEPRWETTWHCDQTETAEAIATQHGEETIVAVKSEGYSYTQVVIHEESKSVLRFVEDESVDSVQMWREQEILKKPERYFDKKTTTNQQKREWLRAAVCYQSSLFKGRENKPATLRYARLSEHAREPTRATEKAAGADLYSAHECQIEPKGKALIRTDLQMAIPTGYYGRIAPRSGLAYKHFIQVGAGVIDEDYRGNVGVLLYNFSEVRFTVKKGAKIAQIIMEKIVIPVLEEVPRMPLNTERGKNGFGHSGW